ncbi:hypothetical protein PFICI_14807 [Pestalotiopsis fici W106-1]|uniref:Heme haloperoxidase family profile domain-containing protein n=1 Tax=Pestalotiopsis fici (strain W106-1 / CGMCC3.15140) TaxID=1229662 RepID=W3WM32_PESFW|nr:uncharacterized protein PFICI_14807 [Pestalotiopsis fici W106-1]ETS73861.1 hypothetical protein PFICI_14807 [Pestalotiopsis fici W106-1]
MRLSLFSGIALSALCATAFPTSVINSDLSNEDLARINDLAAKISADVKAKRVAGIDAIKPGFDADAQRIDTTGDHAWIAPGPGDIRGSCPGLNTLANHGYMARNGVGTVLDIINGSVELFGMGVDLATFLTVYSAVMAGDLATVSIGGKPPSSALLGVGGLLGQPQGLSNSHNRFESDVSPTRADLYITGDPVSLNMSQFETLYNMPQGPNGYDLTVMHPFRGLRFQNSVNTNPYFFNGPFTGLAVQTATYVFTYRFFANHSAEYPEGFLDSETLKSFESVVGEPGSFQWIPGHERVPDNWYRRAIGDEFGLAAFTLDAMDALRHLPNLLVLGGNTGKPNTFTGVNVTSLTSGVFNAETLLEGNNAMCLAFQTVSMASPDILRGLVGNVAKAVQTLAGPLNAVISALGCPQLQKYDSSLFNQYPGSKGAFS